jgi:hypothetical protein
MVDQAAVGLADGVEDQGEALLLQGLLQQLEQHYLSNPDPLLQFALLTDDLDGEAPEARLQRRADDATRAFKGGRRHIPEDGVETHRPLASDLRQRLLRLLVDFPELKDAKGVRYRFTWRTTEWRSKGAPVWGSSKPIPQPQREKFGIRESWEVILSLPVWLLLDDEGRNRLLHHELMHAARNCRGHDVEEWPETVARYGLGQQPQALLALAGVAHKSTLQRIEVWGLLPGGQLAMFQDAHMERIEVKVGIGR